MLENINNVVLSGIRWFVYKMPYLEQISNFFADKLGFSRLPDMPEGGTYGEFVKVLAIAFIIGIFKLIIDIVMMCSSKTNIEEFLNKIKTGTEEHPRTGMSAFGGNVLVWMIKGFSAFIAILIVEPVVDFALQGIKDLFNQIPAGISKTWYDILFSLAAFLLFSILYGVVLLVRYYVHKRVATRDNGIMGAIANADPLKYGVNWGIYPFFQTLGKNIIPGIIDIMSSNIIAIVTLMIGLTGDYGKMWAGVAAYFVARFLLSNLGDLLEDRLASYFKGYGFGTLINAPVILEEFFGIVIFYHMIAVNTNSNEWVMQWLVKIPFSSNFMLGFSFNKFFTMYPEGYSLDLLRAVLFFAIYCILIRLLNYIPLPGIGGVIGVFAFWWGKICIAVFTTLAIYIPLLNLCERVEPLYVIVCAVVALVLIMLISPPLIDHILVVPILIMGYTELLTAMKLNMCHFMIFEQDTIKFVLLVIACFALGMIFSMLNVIFKNTFGVAQMAKQAAANTVGILGQGASSVGLLGPGPSPAGLLGPGSSPAGLLPPGGGQ